MIIPHEYNKLGVTTKLNNSETTETPIRISVSQFGNDKITDTTVVSITLNKYGSPITDRFAIQIK